MKHAGMDEEALTTEFTRVDIMRLRIARTWMRPDFSIEQQRQFAHWVQTLQGLGTEVALHTGWFFPRDVWYFAHENWNHPLYTAKTENFRECCDRLAGWVSRMLEFLIELRGCTNIKYLMLFHEPTEWTADALPTGVSLFEAYAMACRAIHKRLIADGRRNLVKLVGPNAMISAAGDRQLRRAVSMLNDVLDIYSAHTYAWPSAEGGHDPSCVLTGYDGWVKHAQSMLRQVAQTGKPFWFDEFGLAGGKTAEDMRSTGWYGNFLAQATAAFMNSGVENAFLWSLFDQKYFWDITNDDSFYHGIQRSGLAMMPGDSIPDTRNVRPAWYAVAMLSRFLSEGSAVPVLRTEAGPYLCGSATVPGEGCRTILLVNRKDTPVQVTVEAGISGLRRYLYNPATLQPHPDIYLHGWDVSTEQSVFTDTLPPFAVAVYTNAPE